VLSYRLRFIYFSFFLFLSCNRNILLFCLLTGNVSLRFASWHAPAHNLWRLGLMAPSGLHWPSNEIKWINMARLSYYAVNFYDTVCRFSVRNDSRPFHNYSFILFSCEVATCIWLLQMYESFVEEIDAIDNGIDQFDGEKRYKITTTLSSRVAHLNPKWNEESRDERVRHLIRFPLLVSRHLARWICERLELSSSSFNSTLKLVQVFVPQGWDIT